MEQYYVYCTYIVIEPLCMLYCVHVLNTQCVVANNKTLPGPSLAVTDIYLGLAQSVSIRSSGCSFIPNLTDSTNMADVMS